MRQRWPHTTAVPADLVEATTRAANDETSGGQPVPRATSNLSCRVSPNCQDLSATAPRRRGSYVPAHAMDPYEPGVTTAAIDGLFDDYAAFLPEFLEEVLHVRIEAKLNYRQACC